VIFIIRRVNEMKKWMWFLIPGALLAGALLAGCFSSPTDPHAGAFSSVKGGGGIVPTATPVVNTGTPTATPTAGIARTGSISGTVGGTGSGTITIQVYNSTTMAVVASTVISGLGAYTITGLADGFYFVHAGDTGVDYAYYTGGGGGNLPATVIVSGGSVIDINITMVAH
jgi:hypothetical protein